MSIFNKVFGDPNQKVLNKLQPLVGKINDLEKEFGAFSDEQLKEKTAQFRQRIEKGETLDDVLVEAFACVREAAKRTLGQRHFDVQLLGGIVLHQGKIAEMKTGEGKTLVATLPLYLNALTGKGAHLVTVNDYLARRDTNWMGPVYHLLGLSIGCIQHESAYLFDPQVKPDKNEVSVEMENLRPVSRQEAYQADIVYGTNNEFGFDYLRDNMATRMENLVQRDLNFVIVDEVDSILIDEARTPLIISAPDVESAKQYQQFAQIVPQLKENTDYQIDEKRRAVTLTEEGIGKVEKILGVENIYQEKGIILVHHLEQALRAQTLFKRDKDYMIKEGEVIIVDEFTGRLMPGRRYSGGLHQAIEAKEGVEVQRESRTLATITFQNYFRLYQKLAGMTGTAATSAEEFSKVYDLDVVVMPTNKPMIRQDMSDRIYKTEKGKFQAVVREIKQRHQKGQPVLLGTASIEKNEILSKLLEKEGIPHQILNAKHHEQEAKIIAQAGRVGAVTVATNMAGRGVDIVLGGKETEETEENEEWKSQHQKVIELGGLHVLGTERHEARRIDNQLRGRAGRQGDPGSSQFFVSLEDDLMRVFGSERVKGIMDKLGVAEDEPIENKMISRSIESAQAKIEGYNFDLRKHILEYDDVMNKHRETIYKKRREVLELPSLKDKTLKMISDEIGKIVSAHFPETGEGNIEEIIKIISAILPVPVTFEEKIKELKNKEEITSYLIDLANKLYEEKEEKLGQETMRQIEKAVTLRTIDMLWMEHLEMMEYLRDSVSLRGYGQRDPLVEYKREGYQMFQNLLSSIQSNVTSIIYRVEVGKRPVSPMETEGLKAQGAPKTTSSPQPVSGKKAKKIGRNDPCPCGATKADGRPIKYKHCHGKNV